MSSPDVSVLSWLVDHRTGWATRGSTLLMSASANVFVVCAAAVLAVFVVVVRRKWAAAAVVGAAGLCAVVATDVLKLVFGRPRPPAALALVHANGFSMPSTDGALTAAVAMAVLIVVSWRTPVTRRVTAAVLAAAVLSVGVALVYLGAHWPSDVLAGWGVGALSGWACCRAGRWALRRRAGLPATA